MVKTAILKLMLTKEEHLFKGMEKIPEEWFPEPERSLFVAMKSLFLSGSTVSFITLRENLQKKYYPIVDRVKSQQVREKEFDDLIVLLREQKQKRECINFATTILSKKDEPADEILKFISDKSLLLLDDSNSEMGKISDFLEQVIDIKNMSKEPVAVGYPTSIPKLDSIIGGFENSTLNILAGRPSTGKSELARQIAAYNGINSVHSVVFSAEESKEMYINKLVGHIAKVSPTKIKSRNLTTGELNRIEKNYDTILNLPIHLYPNPDVTLSVIYSQTRQIIHTLKQTPIIVLDYIQLIAKDESNEEVSRIAKGLKLIARKLSVPVIAISQLSRASEQRETSVPKLSDLRGSGSLEQAADKILFLTVDGDPFKQADVPTSLWVLKNREGPKGMVRLINHGVTQTLSEVKKPNSSKEEMV